MEEYFCNNCGNPATCCTCPYPNRDWVKIPSKEEEKEEKIIYGE